MKNEEYERPLQTFESPYLFREQISAEKDLRMSRKELPPSQAFAIRRWRQTVASKDVRHRGFGDLDARLLEFALDFLIAPDILSGQLTNQGFNIRWGPRSSRSTSPLL
jgi:hypothetical protein